MSEIICWALHLNGASKRYAENSGAAVGVGHNVYSFGGDANSNLMAQMDVHIFNTVSLQWRKLPPVTPEGGERHLEVPSMCVWHTAVLIEDRIYIWGGFNYVLEKLCNVLYAFDVDTHRWFKPQVSGAVPEGREGHSASVLWKVMYVYGGCTQDDDSNAMYKLDTSTMSWTLMNTRGIPAQPSYVHSATIIGTKIFVFGDRRHADNTVRMFDTETNSWLSTPSAPLLPKGFSNPGAFAYNGELYIFGGYNLKQSFNDLWKFSPETFSWKKVEPKGNRLLKMRYAIFCCMVGDRIVLFYKYKTPNELYILDLSPSLKTLCKLAVIQYDLERSELPHDIRWELRAMTANSNSKVH